MNEDGNGTGEELKARTTETVEREVGSLSSNVLDMLGAKGKVTEPGPSARPCETDASDSENVYRVRHPWSLYGVENEVLQEAMGNLKQALPDQGWHIEKHGKDGSKDKNLEILAVHRKTRSQLEVTWLKGLDGNEPLIEVSLYSRCFKDSGTSDAASNG